MATTVTTSSYHASDGGPIAFSTNKSYANSAIIILCDNLLGLIIVPTTKIGYSVAQICHANNANITTFDSPLRQTGNL